MMIDNYIPIAGLMAILGWITKEWQYGTFREFVPQKKHLAT